MADDTSNGPRRTYFEFSVDGKSQGRIVVELYEDVTVGSARFADLALGKMGVGYRRSKIDGVFKGEYIKCAGVASLSYSIEDSPIAGGDSTADLERELARSSRKHDAAGLVSLQVKLPEGSLVTSKKLVASQGKLVEITETSGIIPNGTAFAVTLGPAPVLDGTNLIVGRVVEGMDVLEKLAELPVVKDNSNSPFFAAGKAIGDKRATVAELGFNRPFSRVIVSKSGLV